MNLQQYLRKNSSQLRLRCQTVAANEMQHVRHSRPHGLSHVQSFSILSNWHAGCSSCEDVYSLVVILKETGLYDPFIDDTRVRKLVAKRLSTGNSHDRAGWILSRSGIKQQIVR